MKSPSPHAEPLPVRDRLLDAAEAVVVRQGVGNLTIDAVAKEAGVSKGGLLYHFPTKSDLVVAIVERLATRCESHQGEALGGGETAGNPGAFCRAYVKTRTRPIDPAEEPVHTALLAAAATDPRYLDPFRKRVSEWQAKLEADGIDPAVATIVRLAIDGMCMAKVFGMPGPTGELRERVIEKLIEMTRCDAVARCGAEGKQHE